MAKAAVLNLNSVLQGLFTPFLTCSFKYKATLRCKINFLVAEIEWLVSVAEMEMVVDEYIGGDEVKCHESGGSKRCACGRGEMMALL